MKPIQHWVLNVTLQLEGPILTAGSEVAQPGIDAAVARDRNGRCMLPFSLVKGRVLEALRARQFDSAKLHAWLGAESAAGDWEPQRGRLRFSDFVTEHEATHSAQVIERIQIGATGTVQRGMLQMIEAPFGYGELVDFEGTISFLADADDAQCIEREVTQALRSVGSFGADRTVGFGVTRKVTVRREAAPKTARGEPRRQASLPWRLHLDRPLCLVGRRVHPSHFESTAEISGAVLKGAVAQLLRELAGTAGARDVSDNPGGDYAALREHFVHVQFTEARPCEVGGPGHQPVAVPLSLALPADWKPGAPWFDLALCDAPRLLNGRAPAFAPDWKDGQSSAIRREFGWCDPPRERRTRTAIDGATGRAADEKLFSYGMVLPDALVDSAGPRQAFAWQGRIELGRVPTEVQESVRTQLQCLLQSGLPGLGKTKATAAVEWLTADLVPAQPEDHTQTDRAVVTLQTECLMTNPALVAPGTADALRQAYEDFWTEASAGTWTLRRFFARQTIRGGFVARRGAAGVYRPFLLTDRGSVFVLERSVKPPSRTTDGSGAADPAALLAQWRRRGLPTPAWVAGFHGVPGRPLWESCGYLPENGFGEVAINLACHFNHQPPATAGTGDA